MSDLHTREMRFRVGRLSVAICASEVSADEIRLAEGEMEILGRLLRGLGSEGDVRIYAELLNGPTLDDRLGRKDVRPCGCRGK